MKEKKKNQKILHSLFILVSIAIIFFLLYAPAVKTPKLPRDEDHITFHNIESKKDAEKGCVSCHSPDAEYSLSESHPQKPRCLFCHKRN